MTDIKCLASDKLSLEESNTVNRRQMIDFKLGESQN